MLLPIDNKKYYDYDALYYIEHNKIRIKESDLIKRQQQDRNHIDYCCPYCESVIICEVKE